MLKKVISGAQTGADRAGLIAAKAVGLETGGHMPKGFLAQDGLHPEFAELYGIQETESEKYPPRTELNVQNSDVTIRFATDWLSPGEKLTKKCCERNRKPYYDIDMNSGYAAQYLATLLEGFEIINVAGNSEKTSPGIQKLVEGYCIDLFKILKESKVAKKATQPKTETKDALPSMVLVSGNTYPIKDQIKAFGGKWDAESKSWWVPSENVKKVKELMNQ